MSKWILLLHALYLTLGCGARPSARSTIQGQSIPIVKPDVQPTETPKTEVDPEAKPDVKTSPETARVTPNAFEIAEAKTAYMNDCSICHGPLAQSAKRGVTLRRLADASVPMAVPLHTEILRDRKWPFDVSDSKADGIDTAVLAASAMVEALK